MSALSTFAVSILSVIRSHSMANDISSLSLQQQEGWNKQVANSYLETPGHHLITAPRFTSSLQTNQYLEKHVIMVIIPEGDFSMIISHRCHGAKWSGVRAGVRDYDVNHVIGMRREMNGVMDEERKEREEKSEE
ncbi:hypothetical protein BPOR_0481g00030 [Botrytis porri]|uniref:Uncharacterized protein n=1 Tax=Botrytis porri TaxID=87229 RepID=A0A4Z1KGH9_9HELO|nr:hypothetical protein BPOR_0481g00030 [Botrytis porri]